MAGSRFRTKITDVSFWNIMEGSFTYGRDDVDLRFQNILYILGPYVCTFSTEHRYYFLIRQHDVFTLKPVLFFLLSNTEPNMLVANVPAFIVSADLLL